MGKRKFVMAKSFKRDLKKHCLHLVSEAWSEVSTCLLLGTAMPEKYKDHPLHGNFSGFRDFHINPDLVLIYRISGDAVELHYLGSHSEVFG